MQVSDLRSLIIESLNECDDDRKCAAETVIERLEEQAENGDTNAEKTLRRLAIAGARAEVDNFCRSRDGRIRVIARAIDVPSAKSIHRRKIDGDVRQLMLPMLDMLFDELRDKLVELAGQQNQLLNDLRVIRRLMELKSRVPAAKTPREALITLGITQEEWLAAA